MGASIVAGVDASPVLEPTEHDLDLVALAVERPVMRDVDRAVSPGWNARGDTSLRQSRAEPVGVVALVGQHRLGGRKSVQHQGRAFVIAHLAFAEQQDERSPLPVADSVELGVQASFGAPDTSGNSPFLSRLTAVRWASAGERRRTFISDKAMAKTDEEIAPGYSLLRRVSFDVGRNLGLVDRAAVVLAAEVRRTCIGRVPRPHHRAERTVSR